MLVNQTTPSQDYEKHPLKLSKPGRGKCELSESTSILRDYEYIYITPTPLDCGIDTNFYKFGWVFVRAEPSREDTTLRKISCVSALVVTV